MKNPGWTNHTLLAASFAIVLMAVGCGRQETQASGAAGGAKVETKMASSQTGGPRDEAVASTAMAGQTPQAETGGETVSGGVMETPSDGEHTARSAASEPPDVIASIADSLIVPGGIVEVTAQASPDVVAVTLTDGISKPKAMSYDPATSVWRTSYRIPLRAATERVGISITATNPQRQWRRVWIFTKSQAVQVAADSDATVETTK